MPAPDTQLSDDALSSIPDSLLSAKDDWGTSSYRNSESHANGRRSNNSSQRCSNNVSHCNDAEDAMVSSPSRSRRKEPEALSKRSLVAWQALNFVTQLRKVLFTTLLRD